MPNDEKITGIGLSVAYIGKNIFILSKSKIYESIQSKFPEFASIRVQKILPSKIVIDLEAYPMVANLKAYYTLPKPDEVEEGDFTELNRAIEDLSGSDPDLAEALPESPLENSSDSVFDLESDLKSETKTIEEKEQKALLNQVGQAIFNQEENLELITISLRGLTQPIQDRERVIDLNHMVYLLQTIEYFNSQLDLVVIGVDYLPIAREIHLKTKNNLSIWLTLEREYRDQVNKLITIYDPAELSKENLAYIDLRIREKVIYCPRYANCDPTK